METKEHLIHEISKLRQKRYYAEEQCEMIGRMLPACLIFRHLPKGTREFRSLKMIGSNIEYKSYGYLTFLYKGRTVHRYIKKDKIEKVKRLTDNYRKFCKSIAEVRYLNKRIVELLDKIGELKMEEITRYVKKRNGIKRTPKKKRTK